MGNLIAIGVHPGRCWTRRECYPFLICPRHPRVPYARPSVASSRRGWPRIGCNTTESPQTTLQTFAPGLGLDTPVTVAHVLAAVSRASAVGWYLHVCWPVRWAPHVATQPFDRQDQRLVVELWAEAWPVAAPGTTAGACALGRAMEPKWSWPMVHTLEVHAPMLMSPVASTAQLHGCQPLAKKCRMWSASTYAYPPRHALPQGIGIV